MAYQKAMTAEEQKQFAKRLRAFRKRYGLTQVDLSAALGLGLRTIGRLENCEFAPFPQTILKFGELVDKYEKAEDAEMDVLQGIS